MHAWNLNVLTHSLVILTHENTYLTIMTIMDEIIRHTGPILIAVFITEMVILFQHVIIIIIITII